MTIKINRTLHTAGEWRATGALVRVEGALGHIAKMSEYNPAEQIANARLMSAAPNMLLLLRTVDKRLDILKREYEGEPAYLMAAIHDDIKAAIKKAMEG